MRRDTVLQLKAEGYNTCQLSDLAKLPWTSSRCSADKISLGCLFFVVVAAVVGSRNSSSTGCCFSALCSFPYCADTAAAVCIARQCI